MSIKHHPQFPATSDQQHKMSLLWDLGYRGSALETCYWDDSITVSDLRNLIADIQAGRRTHPLEGGMTDDQAQLFFAGAIIVLALVVAALLVFFLVIL